MFCSKCGKENPENSRFCMKCGYPFGEQHQKEVKQVKESKTGVFPAAGIIVTAAVAVIVMIAGVSLMKKNEKKLDTYTEAAKEAAVAEEAVSSEEMGMRDETDTFEEMGSEEAATAKEVAPAEQIVPTEEAKQAEETVSAEDDFADTYSGDFWGQSENEREDISIDNADNKPDEDENGEYILPESNSRFYDKRELEDLSKSELRIARNEIYARHGRKFKDEMLKEYFNSKNWYEPDRDEIEEAELNEYEIKNRDLIRELEE